MNYLAHAWLADGCSDAFRLGNLMADHIKGPAERAVDLFLSRPDDEQAALLAGIHYHRAIDRAVDSDPDVLALRRMFKADFRRYAGIVLDMAWDHQLALQWRQYHPLPLDVFAHRQYQLLHRFYGYQPESMQRMAFYMSKDDWLTAYKDFSGIEFALQGMSRRIKRRNQLAEAAEEIRRLDRVLGEVFPEIIDRLGAIPRVEP